MGETIREIKNRCEGKYDYVEIYKSVSMGEHFPITFHTDNCFLISCDEFTDYENPYDEDKKYEYIISELMDKEDYENSILANTSIRFTEIYDDTDKILCIMI